MFLRNRGYYVYILTNVHRTVLYVGVTNDLEQRTIEHYRSRGQNHCFTGRYHVHYLLYYEPHQYINNAIAREKEIKLMTRAKKMQIITDFNPVLEFLNEKMFGCWPRKNNPAASKAAIDPSRTTRIYSLLDTRTPTAEGFKRIGRHSLLSSCTPIPLSVGNLYLQPATEKTEPSIFIPCTSTIPLHENYTAVTIRPYPDQL